MSFSFQLLSHPKKLLRKHLLAVGENSKDLIEGLFEVCHQSLGLDLQTTRRIAYLVGVAHDVGKATRYFQDYLPPKRIKPKDLMLKSHSMLSAIYGHFAARKLLSDSQYGSIIPMLVSLAIQGHHSHLEKPTVAAAGNLDWEPIIADQISAIERRDELDLILEEAGLPRFSEFSAQAESEISNRVRMVIAAQRETAKRFGKDLTAFFLLNTLFSVLIDADRMDAADLAFPERREVESANVETYVVQLSDEGRRRKNANSTIANGRDNLFRILSEKARQVQLNQRIYSLTAPTGYGKTLSGLCFSLKLRERLGLSGLSPRIIYVAPYLSILDQNFERIAEALAVGPTQSNVLLLHHHLAEMQYQNSQLSGEAFSTLESELLIEGWNAEVIVTSFIQFFYATIGSKPSQLRKLHNMAGSIVVLDEVQTIPHEFWGLVREILRFITEKLRMYVILMTATQPLIFSKDDAMELAADLPSESWTPRVTVKSKINNDLTLEEFIKEVNELTEASRHKSILIVMNTIDSSVRVYNDLKTHNKKYYLSGNIVPAHRKERIGEIEEALKRRAPLVVVSTQVVEAGVDLDFDMVIRDIGPVDSIVQVAGRCNRNGLRGVKDSEVFVYSVVDRETRAHFANRIYGNYLIEKSRSVLTASHQQLDPFHLAQEYYLAVQEGASELRSRDLLRAMSELDYRKLQEFRLIDEQPNFSVYVEVDEKATHVWDSFVRILDAETDSFKKKEAFLKLRQDFYSYVINVSTWETEGLEQTKGFYHISPREIGVLYSKETGFVRAAKPKPMKQRQAWID